MRSNRWIQATVVACALGVVSILSLSDSVLPQMRRAASAGYRLVGGFEAGIGFDLVSRSDIPFNGDTIAHFLLWAGIGAAAGGLATKPVHRLNVFVALFTLSALVEVAQQYLSWSRSAELTDLAANGAGLLTGLVGYAVIEAVLAHTVPRPPAGP